MKKYAIVLALNILFLVAFMAGVVAAQTGQVTFLGSAAGTTVTNCGTPATPSICGVATGYFVWQNAASGWVLIGAAGATGPQGIQGPPGATGAAGAPASAPSLTINGTQKTLPASFTISAAASTISAN